MAPENTLSAMKMGLSNGFELFECDVQLTKDAELVVIHDHTLDRTTNGTGCVREKTLSELRLLDSGSWFSQQFAGERIPTFQELIEFVKEHDILMNVELKPFKSDAVELASSVAMTLEKLPNNFLSQNLWVSSFDKAALIEFEKYQLQIPRSLLVESVTDEEISWALDHQMFGLSAHHSGWSDLTVLQAQSHNLYLAAYTVNDADNVLRLSSWGVQAFFTDNLVLNGCLPD